MLQHTHKLEICMHGKPTTGPGYVAQAKNTLHASKAAVNLGGAGKG
jgi:hypothetical protein